MEGKFSRMIRREELQKQKERFGYSDEQLSELTGISVKMLQRFFEGEEIREKRKISSELEEILIPENVAGRIYIGNGRDTAVVREETIYGKSKRRQGEYTIEDYFCRPKEERIELIDGVIYDVSGTVFAHQMFVGELYYRFQEFMKKQKDNCIPFTAPSEVQLDCDDKTIIQPDAGILCRREKLKKGRIFGAPDFLVEVLTPATRRKDMTLKLKKYETAGVREYWMVDLCRQKVVTYFFEEGNSPMLYGFDARIPVRIFEGNLIIDMKEMREWTEEDDWR